jgi:hypothetical protein
MRNWWIRFGCFLTGYNYSIVYNSSEVAAKAVKRYTAAMLIVCILWAFVGYTFTQRYLHGSSLECVAGAIIAIIIVVQIERQIILATHQNAGLYIFRACLALMMALIGAVIIDQIILKEDIDLEKIDYIDKKAAALLPTRTSDLNSQKFALDTIMDAKEREKQRLIDDVSKRPLIANVTSSIQVVPVPLQYVDSGVLRTKIVMKSATSYQRGNSPNPNQALIGPLDTVISVMRLRHAELENKLLNVRPALVEEIKGKTGFLDELKVMYLLISKSGVALGFWLLWLLFFLFIEMLVLFSKIGDKSNDYDKTVRHQMDLQMRKLDALAGVGNSL